MKVVFGSLLLWKLAYVVAQQFPGDEIFHEFRGEGATSECQVALNATLDCSWMLGDSLLTTQESIHAACPYGDNKIEYENGDVVASTNTIDHLLDSYQKLCFKGQESQQYCYVIMREWENQGVGEAKHKCHECLLGLKAIYFNSTEAFNTEAYEEFTSLTESCKKTSFHPPTPPSTTEISSTATDATSVTAQSCASTYTIKEDDTCNSVSIKHSVSTDALTFRNSIPAYCQKFPKPGTKLCIPEPCDIYTVKKNDTCYSVISKVSLNITVTQLLSWNPNLNPVCSNMGQQEGMQICVSSPGEGLEDPSKIDSGAKMSITPAFEPSNVA